jgi:hypothetical protein
MTLQGRHLQEGLTESDYCAHRAGDGPGAKYWILKLVIGE